MVANLILPQPAAVGDEWGNALNTGVQAVNADVEAQKGRTIATGLGLLGGGDLSANRTLSVDFAASGASSATKAVRADDSRLSDARTPVAHSHAYSTLTGIPATFAPSAHAHVQSDVTNLVTDLAAKAPTARLISAGSGLTGGGSLAADRTLAVDLATANPLGLGLTAAVGTATKSAREDHVHAAPAWQAYTPAWTASVANPTLGNGSLVGRYFQVGKFIVGRIYVLFGTTTNAGSGVYQFTLPAAAVANNYAIADGVALDAGVRHYYIKGILATSTVMSLLHTDGTVNIQHNSPVAFGNADVLALNFKYEAV